MGRTLSNKNSGIDLFDRGGISKQARALQQGTPKGLVLGEVRACYAMLSKNDAQSVGSVAFYDKHFQPLRAAIYGQSPSLGNMQSMVASGSQGYNNTFSNVASTANQGSSNAGYYMNSTTAAGEFGNAYVDSFSNSTILSASSRNADEVNVKNMLNRGFIDSDHPNTAIVYVLIAGSIRAVSRVDGDHLYAALGTESFPIAGFNSNIYGSASYNQSRKELIAIDYVGTGGNMSLITWQGVDFLKYPCPKNALNQANVVKTVKPLSLAAGWPGNTNESQYNCKPVLCDNGDIYILSMHPSNSVKLFKVTRDVALTPTVTLSESKSLTTSYGADQAPIYGARKMQSRDGGAVLLFTQYYYYHSGLVSWVIDKRKSLIVPGMFFDVSDSSSGHMPVPYGDSGFAVYFTGNVYAGNPFGAYIRGCIERNFSGALTQVSGKIYLPYMTWPDTTNYPGFTQVTDYSLLNNQTLSLF